MAKVTGTGAQIEVSNAIYLAGGGAVIALNVSRERRGAVSA